MLAIAATQLGMRTHIFCPEEKNVPAEHCATATSFGAYNNESALAAFAKKIDVATYEFENVPVETVTFLQSQNINVAPGYKALQIAQDRFAEKRFLNDIGARTAAYERVDDVTSLAKALAKIGTQSILKTRRFGYDGKGQTTIQAREPNLGAAWNSAIEHAWNELGQRPSILEGFVDFDFEISIVAARDRDNNIQCFPPSRNFHQNGILRTSTLPSGASAETILKAVKITKTILTELDYIGVIGVEFFVLNDGDILVNEFAPRVHNSGHWTGDACAISQFEQHIRAVAGWPLGDPRPHSNAEMENLIGSDADRWHQLAREPNCRLHLYGKQEMRPGRKMGHVTRLHSL